MKRNQLSRKEETGLPEPRKSSEAEIGDFLSKARMLAPVEGVGPGRMVFALDATMSRQPTWDMACMLQGEMFTAAEAVGNLSVQLVYFRGHGEARASRWVRRAESLRAMMEKIDCRGGLTQIEKVLAHTLRVAEEEPLQAFVYVGDAMEEDVDKLCGMAGKLSLAGVKAFMFHDGTDPSAAIAFREIARLTGGVYLPFNSNSADELKALLVAVATYAAGGREALEMLDNDEARQLLSDMR